MSLTDDGAWWAIGATALLAGMSTAVRLNRGRSASVGIHFTDLDKEQLGHVFEAQSHLRQAGVDFDTGYDMQNNTRDWEFDWSLQGPVEVDFRRFGRD